MLARVTTSQGKPEQIEAGIRNYREQVRPAAKKMAGFKGAYLLVDRKSGKMLGIALWDTEGNLQASTEAAAQLRAGVLQASAATKPPTVEVYEVAVQL
jgi:heme-degrading monooxygenase HmoA